MFSILPLFPKVNLGPEHPDLVKGVPEFGRDLVRFNVRSNAKHSMIV